MPDESRKIDPKYADALATWLDRLLKKDFGGVQRKAEEKIGISQAHISQILKGSRASKGIGLAALIKLHEYSGASFDEMLGVSPRMDETTDDRLSRLEREVQALRSAKDATPTPPRTSTVRPKRGAK